MYKKVLVLDTCAVLWLASGNSKLSTHARELIDHCSMAWVSAISAWEIALKVSQKKLILPKSAQEWFEKVVEQHGLSVAALDIELMIASTALPSYHRDPADRFIIATAIKHKAPVVTGDEQFSAYKIETIC